MISYSSERYSDLNNLFYMEATFEDTDTSIESTYVWFVKGTKPTPMYIDLNNDITPIKIWNSEQRGVWVLTSS